jgi:hypothetical protein
MDGGCQMILEPTIAVHASDDSSALSRLPHCNSNRTASATLRKLPAALLAYIVVSVFGKLFCNTNRSGRAVVD